MIVHQMGSVLCYGDAITNAIAALDRQLVAWGLTTRMYGADVSAARLSKAESDTAYTALSGASPAGAAPGTTSVCAASRCTNWP